MSYLVAAYAVAIGGIALYAVWLARARRTLLRELSLDEEHKSRLTAERAERYKLMGS